ncbi:MAG: tRNA lysidine(34) synthetase TilS [Planctomycetota bacterium]|nr:tRNA lysidine(34) synthetase TilS [Planctomycetota bacterium]
MDSIVTEHSLLTQLESSWPLAQWQGLTVVVAISGGADSVSLAHALSVLAGRGEARLVLAHFDHRWREESVEDARFVEQLAGQLGWKFVQGQAVEPGVQSEQLARRQRYAFLLDVARSEGARFVVTAHTADDQVETILDRILRGTGLRGLAGIPRTRVLDEGIVLLRPLLCCSQSDLRQYLAELGQPWREDPSNQDTDFTRNRIRQVLLPLLRSEFQPSVEESLRNLAELAGQTQQFLGQLAGELAAAAVTVERDHEQETVTVSLPAVAPAAPLVVREMLVETWCQLSWPRQAMGMRQWNLLEEMLLDPAAPGQQTFPGNVLATRDEKKSGGQLKLTRRLENASSEQLPGN